MLWSMIKTNAAPRLPTKAINKTNSKVLFDQSNIILRNQTFADVEHTRDTLMRAEGWSGMLHFWPIIYAVDQNGYYMLLQNNKKIASISMVSYPGIKFAYVGMFIVDKKFRGQGFGKMLFEKILNHTLTNRGITTIGLNCYEAMSPLYRRLGFETHTVDGIWKLTGFNVKPIDTIQLSTLSTPMLSKLIAYDATVFSTTRGEFLRGMVLKPNTVSVFAEEGNQIQGYGIMSQRDPAQPEAAISYRIGPLYANNKEIANELLQRLVAAVNLLPEQAVYLEAPDNNIDALEILMQFGFKRVASMDKMYLGTPPKVAEAKIFGYTSLAFGG